MSHSTEMDIQLQCYVHKSHDSRAQDLSFTPCPSIINNVQSTLASISCKEPAM